MMENVKVTWIFKIQHKTGEVFKVHPYVTNFDKLSQSEKHCLLYQNITRTSWEVLVMFAAINTLVSTKCCGQPGKRLCKYCFHSLVKARAAITCQEPYLQYWKANSRGLGHLGLRWLEMLVAKASHPLEWTFPEAIFQTDAGGTINKTQPIKRPPATKHLGCFSM